MQAAFAVLLNRTEFRLHKHSWDTHTHSSVGCFLGDVFTFDCLEPRALETKDEQHGERSDKRDEKKNKSSVP